MDALDKWYESLCVYFLFFIFFLEFEVNEVKTKLRPAIRTLSTGWKSSLRLMIGSLWLSFNLGLQLSSPRFYIPKDNGTWLLSPRVHGGSTEEERTKSSFERSAIVRLERKRKCSSTFFFSFLLLDIVRIRDQRKDKNFPTLGVISLDRTEHNIIYYVVKRVITDK